MQKSNIAGNAYTKNTSVKLRGLGIPALKSRLDAGQDDATGWKSAGGDVSYRDAVLPPAQKRITREQLDRQLISTAPRSENKYLRKISNGDEDGSFTTLARCCLRVIAENIGEKVIQDSLANPTRIMHPRHVENLCRRVTKRFHGREIPFSVWQVLLSVDADAIPADMKTYTGLAFDDTDELTSYNSVHNTTLLDLSNTAFQKADIYKIRMFFSNSLVALRLDHLTLLDNDTITALSRDVGAEEGQAFAKLEVLTLKGCKLITDKSAPKFARFTGLKLLDLRGTSCTTATKDILRQLTKPPYVSAFTPVHLSLFTSCSLDETYRSFSRAINTPLVKDVEDMSETLSAADEPCILVTALTRLDDTKVLDPRAPTVKNRFVASHHIYGNVYTSVPISNESLREDGSQETAKGAAFRFGKHAGVMSGQLPISQADVGWKRFMEKKALQTSVTPVSEEDASIGDSDLELSEEDEHEAPTIDPARLNSSDEAIPAFYRQAAVPQSQKEAKKETPQKDPMMLLRFFKPSSSSVHALVPAQAVVLKSNKSSTRLLDDQAEVRVKKRPRISLAESISLQKQMDRPHVMASSSSSSSASSPQLSSGPLSQQISKGPTAIKRKPAAPSNLKFANVLSKSKSWS